MNYKNLAILACLAIIAACQSSSANLGEKHAGKPAVFEDGDVIPPPVHETPVELVEESNSDNIDSTIVGSISKSGKTPAGSKIVINTYNPPRVGTIFYWKNNWNSLPKRLVHKVTSHAASFAGKTAIQMDAIDDTGNGTKTFLDAKTSNLLGHKDKNGNAVVVFPKVEERLRFPMKPGDQWVTAWKSVDRSTQKSTEGGGVVKVIGAENLVIASKRLKTMKIRLPIPLKLGKGMKHFIWYSPKYGVVVREQVSNGTFVWVKELEKVKLPG